MVAKSYLHLLDYWSRAGFPNLDQYIRDAWDGVKFNFVTLNVNTESNLGFSLTPDFTKPFDFEK